MKQLDETTSAPQPILEALHLRKYFPLRQVSLFGPAPVVHAVEDASLALYPGKALAIVGESGSGKTTIARMLARIYAPTSGTLRFRGAPVDLSRHGKALREYRRHVQLVFQDPFSSLNPVHTVRYHLSGPLRVHGHTHSRREEDFLPDRLSEASDFRSDRLSEASGGSRVGDQNKRYGSRVGDQNKRYGSRVGDRNTKEQEQILSLLNRVNLNPAEQFIEKYPHQLSGGQRQRVAIARTLAVQPEVLLADEPVSMLDVSIRLDILNLLLHLKDEEHLALLFITHDIASARYFAEETLVMYAGQTVEFGPSDEVIQDPKHPYTQLLLSAAPDPERANSGEKRSVHLPARGEIPSLINPPTGCRFHPRCPHAMAVCKERFPRRTDLGNGHWTHCFLYGDGNDNPLIQPEGDLRKNGR